MCQLMSHDGLLTFKVDPICQVKLLCFGIVITSYLFREKFDEECAILKIRWCKTKGLAARPLDLVGYGDEDEHEAPPTAEAEA